MRITEFYRCRDWYDFERYDHCDTIRDIDQVHLDALVKQYADFVKTKSLPWFMVVDTVFAHDGSEPVVTVYNAYGVEKQKRILNPKAKTAKAKENNLMAMLMEHDQDNEEDEHD